MSQQQKHMNCRWGEVILLDGRSVEILIQPLLFAGDLFDTVASHFDLKEKEYFGLAFLDETGQYNWLNLERRVLEHEYAQKQFRHPPPPPLLPSSNHQNNVDVSQNQPIAIKSSSTTSIMNNHHYTSQTINTNKRLLTKSTSRLPTVSKIKSLKNKSKSSKSTTTISNSSSSIVDSFKNPLARLMHTTTKSNNNKTKLITGHQDMPTRNTTTNCDETPPPLPPVPPPPLPLILDTPEIIMVNSKTKTSVYDDPLYDVIIENNSFDTTTERTQQKASDHHTNHALVNNQAIGNNYTELFPKSSTKNVHDDNSSLKTSAISEINGHDLDLGNIEDHDEEDDDNDGCGDDGEDNDDDRLVLYFLVKYFVESISMLQDTNTIELFYLQAKSLLVNEIVQVDPETSLKLSALMLQATYGDCINFNETKTRNRIHRLQLISSLLLAELTSYQNCEDHILEEYRRLSGVSHGESIFRFMTLIEKQPTYGVHFYEVKDKSGTPYWLGLSFKGIDQFSYTDRRLPLKQFAWKQLENLYFREKKFSIEVRDLKRVVHTLSSINLYENAIDDSDTFDDLSTAICDPTTQVSVSRRTFGPCNVTVYVWFSSTSSLTKCIWSMAISQHQFYIDRRINKNIKLQRAKEDIVRCLDENYRLAQLFHNQKRNSYSSGQSIQRNSLYSNTSSLENQSSSTPTSYSSTNSLSNYPPLPLLPPPPSIYHQEPLYHHYHKSSSLISLNQMETNSFDSCSSGSNVCGQIAAATSGISEVSRTNSQTLLQQPSSFLLHRHAPFRHSTSTSSIHKMSTTTSSSTTTISSKSTSFQNRSSKNNKMNRLRQLQAQLQIKLDELNHLDLLEQQILSKISSKMTNSLEPNDASSTITSASSNSSSSSSIHDPYNINRGSIASSTSSIHINNKNNGPSSSTLTKAPNSLKNFVVTGRTSSSLSQTQNYMDSQKHPTSSRLAPNYQQTVIMNNNNCDQPISFSIQRSKSVGVSSRFGVDLKSSGSQQKQFLGPTTSRQQEKILKVQKNLKNPYHNPLPPIPVGVTKMVTHPTLNQVTSSTTMPMMTSNHLKTSTMVKNHQKHNNRQVPLFSSPYVNKYDTSVQNLLNDNERSNLYSVPNRRTSVALNSLDDTVLHQRLSSLSSSSSVLSKNNPFNLIQVFLNNNHQQNQNKKYSIITTSVTSSINSLTYSTVSYHVENNNNLNKIVTGKHGSLSINSLRLNDLVESSVDGSIDGLEHSNHKLKTSKTKTSQYKNIDEENLAHYKSFILSRSNSFGSNKSASSSSENNYQKDQHHSTSNQLNELVKTVESNYANVKPRVNSNCSLGALDSIGPLSTSSKVTTSNNYQSASANTSELYANLLPRITSQDQNGQNNNNNNSTINHYQNHQYSDHIYQNSQTLLTNSMMKPTSTTIEVITTSTSMATTNHLSPKRPPKTWFETDLDFHVTNPKTPLNNSIYKPIIKPSSTNLVFNYNNGNRTPTTQKILPSVDQPTSTSTTIYHPIHLVTTDDQDDLIDGENKQKPKTSVTYYNYYQPNHHNHNMITTVSHHSSMVSPTPSQTSNDTTQSSSSLLLQSFNNNNNNQQNKSTIYSNLPLLPTSINLSSSTSGGNDCGSIISLPSITDMTSTMTTVRPAQAMSPICTVAFVPPSTIQHDTITTATIGTGNVAASQVPIASCKGNIVEVDVVTVGHFQPGYEETKPFTMSDFYKYSQRYRQAQKNKMEDQHHHHQQQHQQKLSPNIGSMTNFDTPLIESKTTTTATSTMANNSAKSDDNNNNVTTTTMVYS